MKALLEKMKRETSEFTVQENLILLSAALLFLPFWLSAPLVFLLLLYPLFKRELFSAVVHQKGAAVLYTFVFLEIAVSAYYGNSIGLLNAIGYLLVAVYTAWYRRIINPTLYYYVVQVFLLLSIAAAVWGLIEFALISQRLGVPFLAFHVANKPDDRIHAMFYNANFYATMLDFFIVFAACSLLKARSRIGKIYFFCLILLNFFMLTLTGCRAALLPLPFYIPVFLWFTNRKKAFKIVLAIEAAILFYIMIDPDVIPRVSDTSTLKSRMMIWQGALEMFFMHPLFGMGPQTYGFMYKTLGFKKAPHAHNIYLDSLASFGLVGSPLLIAYLITIWKEIIKVPTKKPVMKYYLPMACCFFISAAVHGLMDCTLNFFQTGMVFFMIINSYCMAWHTGKNRPLPIE